MSEYMSCLTYRHRYALVLLCTEFQSAALTPVGRTSRVNTSSASWRARSASRIPDQLDQLVPSNCGRVMPAGMPNMVLPVVPSRVTAPADAAPFPVEVEAGGTAVGVADCTDMIEMVSVAKEL